MSDKRPDFAGEAERAVRISWEIRGGEFFMEVVGVKELAERLYDAGRESMREERDHWRQAAQTRLEAGEVLKQQRDELNRQLVSVRAFLNDEAAKHDATIKQRDEAVGLLQRALVILNTYKSDWNHADIEDIERDLAGLVKP